MKIAEKDIQPLDYIVKTCYDKGYVLITDLKIIKIKGNAPEGFNTDRWKSGENYRFYRKYFEMLKELDSEYDFIEMTIDSTYEKGISKGIKTSKFLEEGGF